MNFLKFEKKLKNGEVLVEEFWINLLNSKNLNFKVLAQFMINIMLIPNSNTYVERMFNHVNVIKDEMRNLLEVATIWSLLKVKSYYLNEDDDNRLFEPIEDHYTL